MPTMLELLAWTAAIVAGLLAILLAPLAFVLLVAAVRPSAVQWAIRQVLRLRYRVRVSGIEHLPRHGPVMVAVNHLSWIDGFMLAGLIPRRGRALVYGAYLKLPILGPLARKAGMIPVADRGHRSMIRAALGVLDDGEVLGIFPESQISRTGLMGPLYRGIELLASKRPDVPIVPVALDNLWGSLFSFSGGRFLWKRPQGLRRTVGVAFGPPLEPPITVFRLRDAILEAGVRAFELRPPRDRGRLPEPLRNDLPRLSDPRFGLLSASSADYERGIIRQTGAKPGAVGKSVPGVALRIVDASGTPVPPDTEARLEALIAGRSGGRTSGSMPGSTRTASSSSPVGPTPPQPRPPRTSIADRRVDDDRRSFGVGTAFIEI